MFYFILIFWNVSFPGCPLCIISQGRKLEATKPFLSYCRDSLFSIVYVTFLLPSLFEKHNLPLEKIKGKKDEEEVTTFP